MYAYFGGDERPIWAAYSPFNLQFRPPQSSHQHTYLDDLLAGLGIVRAALEAMFQCEGDVSCAVLSDGMSQVWCSEREGANRFGASICTSPRPKGEAMRERPMAEFV